MTILQVKPLLNTSFITISIRFAPLLIKINFFGLKALKFIQGSKFLITLSYCINVLFIFFLLNALSDKYLRQ